MDKEQLNSLLAELIRNELEANELGVDSYILNDLKEEIKITTKRLNNITNTKLPSL